MMECIIVIRERFAGLKFVDFTQWSFSRENFHDILCLNHLNNAIIQSLIVYINEYSQKTLTVLLKTTKTWKFSPASLSTFTLFTKYILSGDNIPSISRAVVCNPILEILIKVFKRSFQDASGFFSSQNWSIFLACFLSFGCSVPIASKSSSSSFSAPTNSNPTSNQIRAMGATTYRLKYLRVGWSEPKEKIACYLYTLKDISKNTICNHMVDFNRLGHN